MLNFTKLYPCDLGFIPGFLSETDPRPAKEQINEAYQHGGGWRSFKGFTLEDDNSLSYPEDPSYPVLGYAKLRDELICFYHHAWIAIIQPDRSFEVARLD